MNTKTHEKQAWKWQCLLALRLFIDYTLITYWFAIEEDVTIKLTPIITGLLELLFRFFLFAWWDLRSRKKKKYNKWSVHDLFKAKRPICIPSLHQRAQAHQRRCLPTAHSTGFWETLNLLVQIGLKELFLLTCTSPPEGVWHQMKECDLTCAFERARVT